MTSYLIATMALLGGYALLMGFYRAGWKAIVPFEVPAHFTPQTSVTVIIPARNEEENLSACIESLLSGEYPLALLEIIVVDDHSVDGTAAIAERYAHQHVRCIKMANEPKPAGKAYKKQALATGIARATGQLIITTDADCTAPPKLLHTLVACYEHNEPVAIIGPVAFRPAEKAVEIFQALDFATMQGVTAAIHQRGWGSMANGANLCFQKEAFEAVGGYAGTNHIVSGDDLLLLHKFAKAYGREKIAYLKSQDAIVQTPPQPDVERFLTQRIRWSSKSGKYGDHRLTAQLALVYGLNLAMALAPVVAFWGTLPWGAVLVLWGLKAIVDSWSAGPVLSYYGLDDKSHYLFLFQPLHILYIVVVGFLGVVGNYTWKDRRVK